LTDQTAVSFAPKSAPPEGTAVVFAEDGRKLTQAARDIDAKTHGLLLRAAELTGFKGKKEQTVDILAPQGVKLARVVLVGLDKPAVYSSEDWLNLGGSVRGLLSGKEAQAAHIFLETTGGDVAPADVASFASARCCAATPSRNTKPRSARRTMLPAPTIER
jgi:leucyl aminopeptidase